jgi:hypothetical protein
MRFPALLAVPSLVAAVFASSALLAGETLTADAIIQKSSDNRTVGNAVQTMELAVFDKSGASRNRTILSKVKRVDGVTRSLVRFEAPADVQGVQFLSVENPVGEDDQWMFMPALGPPAQRIAGSSKKGSFMATDFTYEDLSIGQPQDATHKLIGQQTLEIGGKSMTVHVIESVPKPETQSAYTKLTTYIDTVDYMPRRVEFYDGRGELSKRMSILEVSKDGTVLVPKRTVMESLKKGTRTEIRVVEYRVNVPAGELPDTLFTREYIESNG